MSAKEEFERLVIGIMRLEQVDRAEAEERARLYNAEQDTDVESPDPDLLMKPKATPKKDG